MLLGLTGSAVEAGSVTLAWDPGPGAVTGYRVYVGVYRGQYNATYDVGRNQTSMVVRDLRDGINYYFAVASLSASGVGPQSADVVAQPVPDGARAAQVFQQPSAQWAPAAAGAAAACAQNCPGASAIALGAGDFGPLAALPDGRVLLVDRGRVLRLAAGGALKAEPALVSGQPTSRFSALAVDPRFLETGVVVVAETDVRDRGRVVSVVRYREVNGILAERAVVAADIPLPPSGDPALVMDAAGDVYLALPGVRDGQPGTVHRYHQDGSVPRDNPTPAPGMDEGPAKPLALVSTTTGEVWSVDGAGRARRHAVVASTSPDAAPSSRSRVPSLDGAVVAAAAFVDARTGVLSVILVSDSGTLWRMGVGETHAVRLDLGVPSGQVTAVSADASGAIYVAVRTEGAPGSAEAFGLLRLTGP